MILVAATAIGLSDFRTPTGDLSDRFLVLSVSLLTSWSLVCLVLRLRQPRPPLSQLMRLPGTSACLAAGIPAFFFHILTLREPSRLVGFRVASIFVGGLSVMAVWGVQKLGNEIEPEDSWVDRLGIALGFCWIALFAIYCAPYVLGG